ncbi:MAG: glycosyltransferase family 4 protein, partial [bacterium]|nr:glycosyltransferase family 4 protein [bacterium]
MKIIHFTPYFPPDRLGGVGEVVAALHQELRDEGHHSTVVTRGVSAQPGVERIARGPLAWFLKIALWAGRAAQYDVVHCQGGEALPVLLLLALRRRRPAILATFHVSFTGIRAAFSPYTIAGRTFGRGLRPLLYRTVVSSLHRLLDAATIRLADAVNTISLQSARDVLGEGRQQDALVVYYGLPELPASAEVGPSLTPTELLYVGSGGPRKRIVALPFVLAHVHREIPEVRMRIIGFTPESEPEVVALFQEHGLLAYVD